MTTDLLVSTQWLADHAADPHVKILDASFKMPGVSPLARQDFLAAHIPGAQFFDIDEVADHSNALPHMFPSAEQFGRQVGAFGVGNEDVIVLYDSGTWVAAPRAWWMFLSFGHRQVRVLDGGLKKWRAEGRPVESGIPDTPKPATFVARFEPERVRARPQLVNNLNSRSEQVVDARARERFEGTAVEAWPGRRSGHIPGSYNVPYGTLINSDGTLKSVSELSAAFSNAGVDRNKPVVTSCGSGVSAAVLALALHRLGMEDVALYDGSWAEWGLPDGPEIATGPSR